MHDSHRNQQPGCCGWSKTSRLQANCLLWLNSGIILPAQSHTTYKITQNHLHCCCCWCQHFNASIVPECTTTFVTFRGPIMLAQGRVTSNSLICAKAIRTSNMKPSTFSCSLSSLPSCSTGIGAESWGVACSHSLTKCCASTPQAFTQQHLKWRTVCQYI